MNQAPAPPIPIAVATELAMAVVGHTAWSSEARAMIIKGETLNHHGLRSGHTSLDVDVLVDPADADTVKAALAARGWRERMVPEVNRRVDPHSWSLVHDDWPCDIDLHYRFPGFALAPADVFEALWARRESVCAAGLDVAIPSRLGSILIMGLHAQREASSRARHRTDMTSLKGLTLTEMERWELAELARETGSVIALNSLLETLGVRATAAAAEVSSPLLGQWTGRVAADGSGAWAWWQLWRSAPAREHPAILYRALWPSRNDLRAAHPHLPPGVAVEVRARVARLARGIRSVPSAIMASRVAKQHDSGG